MRYLSLLLLMISATFATEFYAKLEPVESYMIKAAVNGKVVFANEEIEGKRANKSKIIEIDSYVDRIELEQNRLKLKAVNQMMQIEDANYKRLLRVTSKSGFEKDTQRLKVINLQTTKADLLTKIANLNDSIKNKKLMETNKYIYSISVKEGDYVSPGTLLYETKDISKAKLEIFVPISDISNIKNKTIYLDNKKTELKINKIYEIADAKHISSYKCEIVIDNPKTFSRLVKIEFK